MSPLPYSALPSCTVYVQRLHPSRLNSQTQITELTDRLRLCFEDYGNILDIIVKRSNTRKGQAFIVFDTPEAASTAQEELDGFEFSPDNPIVTSIARTASDAVVERFCSEEEFREHKERRLAEKARKNAEAEALQALQNEEAKKRAAADSAAGTTTDPRKAKLSKPASKANVVPSEYLPPNRLIMVENVPADYSIEALTPMFSGFEGFIEVRKVEIGRFKGLVFVEFTGIPGATAAKEALGNTVLGENVVKITYAKD
ncbi:RNA-binding domain-containing protein [Tothia fuscella]|uniref:RNA-binding domain-containing protein n=1 Tax=Tothia fuscella TaxID=1048955 RepID=A0A9P4TWX4_9PEZI|nr:RNA-binding domain-containing protein [Tothia fuscella]